MPLTSATIWQLRAYRALLALAAPDVSLSFFWWFKEPGNFYATFYPTRWLPAADDREAREDRVLGASIFRRVVRPGEPPCRFTVADYGAGTLELPAWSMENADENVVVCEFERDEDPFSAARRLRDALDIEGLARLGQRDSATSELVDEWLDRVIARAELPSTDSMQMDFDANSLPMALWMSELHDEVTGTYHDVWWRDRCLQGVY